MTKHIKHPIEPRRITPADRHFYFGYYDRQPMSADGRYHLALHPAFMDRPNTGADRAEIGLIDLANGNLWTPLDDATAWNWQMGSCQQWLGSAPSREIIYNVRAGRRAFARTRDINSGKTRDLPRPIYDLSRDGAWGISVNFGRIHRNRPGYGYPDLDDPNSPAPFPEDEGLWWMNLATGESRLIVSLAAAAALERVPSMEGVQHWFNHVMVSPGGTRLIFIHRWRLADGRHQSRLLSCNPDGGDLYLLNPAPVISHCDWRDETHILCFCAHGDDPDWGYYLLTDRSREAVRIGADVVEPGRDGHCHYYPRADKRWFVTDTYPELHEKGRGGLERDLMLYDTETGTRIDIARLCSLDVKVAEIRCDFHPRWDPAGRVLSIDSFHEGYRGIYLLDVGGVVGS